MTHYRVDRGATLAAPQGSIFEGVAARAHPAGDPLEYPEFDRIEHRDASELASIRDQLAAGVPVTWQHPATMPASADRNAAIIGRTVGARIDGDNVVAKIEITSSRGLELIKRNRQLSLGYNAELVRRDGLHYQTRIAIDHLAIVPEARCGATCGIRADHGRNGVTMSNDPERAAYERMSQRTAGAWRSDASKSKPSCGGCSALKPCGSCSGARVISDDDGAPAMHTDVADAAPAGDREAAARRAAAARTSAAWKSGGAS